MQKILDKIKQPVMRNELFLLVILTIPFVMIKKYESRCIQQFPAPYNQLLKILPLKKHGWYLNARPMEKLFLHNKIKSVIEVGSWLGASTSHMGRMLPAGAKLYAVDTWAGSEEHVQGLPEIQALLPTLYEQFLSNMIHCGLTSKVVPIRSDSVQAVPHLQKIADFFDLVYLDAAHDTQSVLHDLAAYFPFVVGGKGILCGDDWSWPSVREAVKLFAWQHNLGVYASENFWFFKENDHYSVQSFVDVGDDVWKVLKN